VIGLDDRDDDAQVTAAGARVASAAALLVDGDFHVVAW